MSKRAKHYRTIHVSRQKIAGEQLTLTMETPDEIAIKVPQYAGDESLPVVKVGDMVKRGQLIAKGENSMPSYASVSGIVTEVEVEDNSIAVTIESDGKDKNADTITKPVCDTRQGFIEQVRRSSVMNNYAPLYQILDRPDLKGVYVAGTQLEPMLTSARRTVIEDMDDLLRGLEVMSEHLNLRMLVVCLEDIDRPAAEEMMAKAEEYNLRGKLRIRLINGRYVQRDKDIYTQEMTGRTPEELKYFTLLRASTVAELGNFFNTGMPCIQKRITVGGKLIETPCNIKVPVGTRIRDVMEYLGGYIHDPRKIVVNGPMQGFTIPNDRLPVSKNMDSLIAFEGKDSIPPKMKECIRCGTCRTGCPMNLSPVLIEKAYRRKNVKDLLRLRVIDCIRCGNCTYICPAKRPLKTVCEESIELLKEAAKDGKRI